MIAHNFQTTVSIITLKNFAAVAGFKEHFCWHKWHRSRLWQRQQPKHRIQCDSVGLDKLISSGLVREYTEQKLFLNKSLLQWHTKQVTFETMYINLYCIKALMSSVFDFLDFLQQMLQVPESACSAMCGKGQDHRVKGVHSCCFDCIDCLAGTK